ncbi:phosphohydrolase [Taibaiella sp. KBW10]|uniref:HD domain-containing protein n=1 Tax=Taibaiella sp. KBW10 TaxID=2153357 RepID=UPI000F5974B1|nr:HD domain-containing protein [Taibaiella sp. KBW10]RQO30166.1 phosphohydrolase [Taibaiella sp. KBW10]
MNYEQIEILILDKLQNELPQHLSYHSVSHVKDVIAATMFLAAEEGVSDEAFILLKTAALFHDTGFLHGAQEHERKSCEIARQYLPEYGYEQEQIEQICGMIMATKIPQDPKNHLEEILADADLDYLGRDDFFTIGDRLYEELSMFGIVNTEEDWNRLQERFLERHHYFTATSIRLRKDKKQEHLNKIKAKL